MDAPPFLRRLAARARTRGRVTLGRDVRLGAGVRFDVSPGARVTIGDRAILRDGCRLHVRDRAVVSIGPGTRLGERCAISAHERIAIGAGCRLDDEVVLVDFDHVATDPEKPVREQGLRTAPVTVGDGAIVDRGVCLLRGASVAPGARVTTHAVVTRSGVAQPAASPTGQLTPVPPRPQ